MAFSGLIFLGITMKRKMTINLALAGVAQLAGVSGVPYTSGGNRLMFLLYFSYIGVFLSLSLSTIKNKQTGI